MSVRIQIFSFVLYLNSVIYLVSFDNDLLNMD